MEYTNRDTHNTQIDVEELSGIFGVLANPTRLAILNVLMDACKRNRNEGLCVNEINEQVVVAQPQVSKHLRVMSEAGILEFRRDKNRIYYHFAPQSSICRVFDFFEACYSKYKQMKEEEQQ